MGAFGCMCVVFGVFVFSCALCSGVHWVGLGGCVAVIYFGAFVASHGILQNITLQRLAATTTI